MLKRIAIQNYKCLENVNLLLPRDGMILLAGANGAGKSTLLEVLEKLRELVGRGRYIYGSRHSHGIRFLGDTFTRWKRGAAKEAQQCFELEVEGNGGSYQYRLVIDYDGHGDPKIALEEVLYDKHDIFRYKDSNVYLFDNATYQQKVSFGTDWSRSFIPMVQEREENQKLIWFRNWLDSLVVLQPNPFAIHGVAEGEDAYLNKDFSNFASWFRYLRQTLPDQDYSAYVGDLRCALPGFQWMRLVNAGMDNKEVRVKFEEIDNEDGYSLDELSEGQKLLIVLYAVIHFILKEPRIVCVDEPDNFLSLFEISALFDAFDEALMATAEERRQALISSHHPEFYDRISGEQGLYARREENGEGVGTRFQKFPEVFSENEGLLRSEIIKRGWQD